ncbi:TetR/AcrR family transcriptional regulator [Actinophytocola sp.]|uniref:TetR/AcrR family transcriptional regulator n=1 Tax=Actinophytocola sp. TaxID=1872138 RepID=UPI002D7EB065|nr:TetR/AcrR family transcriptional regulator [Actinophytocola sp.]HET9139365.1 TetR/AcrR family transcriptional regulator [Actinophytocola sp.]HEU5108917.1 TetR/AcrR family transcriptional regulator [Micromonosporaceae bacterium]
MGTRTGVKRLTRDDWTAAALAALADGGLVAVAIEPLAARLGTTKGSAYWHFPNRDALVRATLERWEREHTDAVIEMIEADRGTPTDRLRRLFRTVLDTRQEARVELALLASAEDPLVMAIVRRVTERRLSYLAALFGQLGLTPAQARRRAALAHSIYLGQAHMIRATPDLIARSPGARRAHVEDSLRTMTVPPGEP